MKNGKMFQDFHPVHCATSGVIAANEDMFNGDPATDIISLSEYGSLLFLVACNAGAVGTATLTVESCDDVTPTTATAVPFNYWECTTPDVWSDMKTATATGFTTAAAADKMYAIEISAEALYSTDSFVRLQCTEVVDGAVDGAILAIAGRGRYQHEVQGTVLA